MRILIIEDDSDIRESIAQLFESEGVIVDTAKNGANAFEVLQASIDRLPDVILLDLSMPVMNGFDFREQQLKERTFCNIPVICVSGMHYSQWMMDKLGADGYLLKPLSMERVENAIRKLGLEPNQIERGPEDTQETDPIEDE
jgi:DNA-binding response OmpR family regulator